ncbi:MAG: response regulator [Lysobacteraceae bacterium]
MTRLLIADDHPPGPALAEGRSARCCRTRIDEAADMADASRTETAPDTDLVLLDLHMPGSHGLVGLARYARQPTAVAVAVVSAHEEPQTIRRALDQALPATHQTRRHGGTESRPARRARLQSGAARPARSARAPQPEPGAEADTPPSQPF